jgi:hypothetical protein
MARPIIIIIIITIIIILIGLFKSIDSFMGVTISYVSKLTNQHTEWQYFSQISTNKPCETTYFQTAFHIFRKLYPSKQI